MNNEQDKSQAKVLTEKELEGVSGGTSANNSVRTDSVRACCGVAANNSIATNDAIVENM